MNREPAVPLADPKIDLWGVVRRRWLTILAGLLLGGGLALFYVIVAPKVYSSQVEILVMRKDPGLPMMAQDVMQRPQEEIGDALLATHMEIIRSPRVIGEAVNNRDLGALESIGKALDPELVQIDRHRAVVTYVIEQLVVERGGEELGYAPLTFVAEFRHGSAMDAATVLAAITEAYQDFLASTLKDVNGEAAGLITEANEDLTADIDQLETVYREFRQTTPLLTLGPESLTKNQIRLATLHRELIELQLRESELRSRATMLADTDVENQVNEFSDLERLGLIDARDVERLSLLVHVERGDANSNETFVAQQPDRTSAATAESERLLSMKVRLREEASRLGESHPDVVELRDSVREIEDYLATKRKQIDAPDADRQIRSGTLVNAYAKVLEKDLEDVRRRIDVVEGRIEEEETEAVSLVDDELREQEIRDELYATKQLQLAVIERLRQLNLMQSYGGFVTEILRAPTYGELAWPIVPLVLAAGLCFGSVGGAGMALLLDLGDRSFRNAIDVEQACGAPLLGVVATMKFRRDKSLSAQLSPELVVYHQPESSQAEAYRHIRTSLMFRPGANDLRLLQLTSPNPGDGKTLTAANLAASLASSGKRVLLVDCDLRRPRLGQLFSVSDQKGLAELLHGGLELNDVILETDISGLSVLPSGARPANPSELLQTTRFFGLLEVLKEKFDMVILDSTPLLAVSESASISGHVDGVILSLRTQNSSRPEAERARKQLESVGVEPLGVVINDIDYLARRGDEANKGYGYKSSYYGGTSKAEKYFQQSPRATHRARRTDEPSQPAV